MKKNLIFLISLLISFGICFTALALEVEWPRSPLGTELKDDSTLTDLAQYFYEWGIALGGIAAFFALIIAGFYYLTSLGSPERMREAKERIFWAIGGLALLLSSWLILNKINPALTEFENIELKLEAVFCDTVDDCEDPEKYICTDENPGDGKKEGFCLKKCKTDADCDPGYVCKEDPKFGKICTVEIEITTEPCKKVIVYEKENFGEPFIEIGQNQCINLADVEISEAHSSVGVTKDDEKCNEDPLPEGCPCGGVIQIFSKPDCPAEYLTGSEAPTTERWATYELLESIKFFAF